VSTVPAAPRYDVEEIKRRYSLADVAAASGVELRRAGSKLWGLCPFHPERKPSFMVDGSHFHCFGACPHELRHGDVITFVMRREGLRFREACARLVGDSPPGPQSAIGMQAPHGISPRKRSWDRLTLEEQLVLNATTTLYREAFWRSPAARAFVRGRGIPDWVARRCGLGYADGRSLEPYLRRHGGLRTAELLGLLRRGEPSDYGRPLREFFAGRVVVPELRDGQPIWLIGRPPNDRPLQVKYLALPGERPVLGLERAAGRPVAYLIEGVFDWLTAIAWGLPAFCVCGTDFPSDRLGWLARARIVYGVLDGDAAGRASAERFGRVLGQSWRTVMLPDGTDLNDFGRQPGGRTRFRELLAQAQQAGATP
jgi:DNA primase